MIDIMTRLGEVKVKTAEALRASEADERAAVVLVAVDREFDSKADEANRQAGSDRLRGGCQGRRVGCGGQQGAGLVLPVFSLLTRDQRTFGGCPATTELTQSLGRGPAA